MSAGLHKCISIPPKKLLHPNKKAKDKESAVLKTETKTLHTYSAHNTMHPAPLTTFQVRVRLENAPRNNVRDRPRGTPAERRRTRPAESEVARQRGSYAARLRGNEAASERGGRRASVVTMITVSPSVSRGCET